jgi:hypothetical protein
MIVAALRKVLVLTHVYYCQRSLRVMTPCNRALLMRDTALCLTVAFTMPNTLHMQLKQCELLQKRCAYRLL